MILPRRRGDHVPRDGLADMKDAGNVGAQESLPLVGREILERRAKLHAGIVNEDVDRRRSSASISATPFAAASWSVTSKTRCRP